jgi:hypothetical protein
MLFYLINLRTRVYSLIAFFLIRYTLILLYMSYSAQVSHPSKPRRQNSDKRRNLAGVTLNSR